MCGEIMKLSSWIRLTSWSITLSNSKYICFDRFIEQRQTDHWFEGQGFHLWDVKSVKQLGHQLILLTDSVRSSACIEDQGCHKHLRGVLVKLNSKHVHSWRPVLILACSIQQSLRLCWMTELICDSKNICSWAMRMGRDLLCLVFSCVAASAHD